MPEGGGTPTPLTRDASDTTREDHVAPWFLPDGRHFVYLRASTDATRRGIWVGRTDTSPDAQPQERLFSSSSAAVFAPATDGESPEHLIFEREGVLLAQPFNADTLTLTGDALRLETGVTPGDDAFGRRYGVSNTGLLVFRRGEARADTARLVWHDRSGRPAGQVGPNDSYGGVNVTPDGNGVVTFVSGVDRGPSLCLAI